jgi:hypothetical protein
MEEGTKIYLVENCYNTPNKIYIGKTKDSRENNHKKSFGSQITYTYIDEVNSLNKEDWEPLETYWIEQFRAWGFEVLNKNNGGGGPLGCSKETRKKIGDKHLGMMWSKETRKKMSNSKIGILRSEETKQKMRKPKSEEHAAKLRKSILQFNKQGKLIAEFESYSSAKEITKINGINNALVGISKTAGGYFWKHKYKL